MDSMTGTSVNDAEYQYKLGQKYEAGDKVIKSVIEARYWYQKAADQGHEAAAKRLEELA